MHTTYTGPKGKAGHFAVRAARQPPPSRFDALPYHVRNGLAGKELHRGLAIEAYTSIQKGEERKHPRFGDVDVLYFLSNNLGERMSLPRNRKGGPFSWNDPILLHFLCFYKGAASAECSKCKVMLPIIIVYRQLENELYQTEHIKICPFCLIKKTVKAPETRKVPFI